jgi:glutamate-1-semialdehyde aminotransferase
MAAGCVSLDLLTDSEIERINGLAASLARELNRVLAEHGWPGYVNVCGSLLNIQVDAGAATERAGDASRAAEFLPRLHLAALEEGVYFASRGALNISTAMDEARVAEVVDAFEQAVVRTAPR